MAVGSLKDRTSNPLRRLAPKQGLRGSAGVGVENGSLAFCRTRTARLFKYFHHTGAGLALHDQIPDNDLPHPLYALNQLDSPEPFLFARDDAAQVDHTPNRL